MISLIKKKGINPQTKQTLYFPQWTRVATTTGDKLAKIMARSDTWSLGETTGILADFPQHLVDELLNGNAVRIGGLGTFKLKVQGKSCEKIDDVTSAGCQVSVVFEPAAELTSRLNDEREFHFVAKPTAEGEQDATDDTPSTSGGGTTQPQPGGGDLEG